MIIMRRENIETNTEEFWPREAPGRGQWKTRKTGKSRAFLQVAERKRGLLIIASDWVMNSVEIFKQGAIFISAAIFF